MSLIQQLLRASIEEMAEELQPVEGQLEENILEVVESQKEIDDQVEATQRLETTAQSLEAFAIIIEAKLDQNIPMTRGEARATRIGMEAMLLPCGFSEAQTAVGLEEFGEAPVPTEAQDEALRGEPIGVATEVPIESELSESEAIQASQEALDNIKQMLTKFWNAIKVAALKVVDMVKGFAVKLIGSSKALKARAEALAKVDLKGKKPGSDKIRVPATLVFEGTGSKGDVVGSDSAAGQLASDIKTTLDEQASCAKKYYAAVKSAMDSVSKGGTVDQEAVKAAGTVKVEANLIPGGLKYAASADGGSTIEKAGAVEPGEIDVLNEKEIKSVAADVLKLVAAIDGKADAIKSVQALHDDVIKHADTLAKAADKGVVGRTVDSAKARWALKSAQRNFTVQMAKLCSIGLRVGYAAVSLGERSAKLHTAGEAAPAAADKKADKKAK